MQSNQSRVPWSVRLWEAGQVLFLVWVVAAIVAAPYLGDAQRWLVSTPLLALLAIAAFIVFFGFAAILGRLFR